MKNLFCDANIQDFYETDKKKRIVFMLYNTKNRVL